MGFLKNLFGDNSAREVTIDEVEHSLPAGDHVLVDVREKDEWNSGHIKEAIHIPLGSIGTKAAQIPQGKPIYTICRSGNRSLTAIDALNAAGFDDVKSMAGGMNAWVQAGKPIKR